MSDGQLSFFGESSNWGLDRESELLNEPTSELETDSDLGSIPYPPVVTNHLLKSGLSRGRIRLAHELVSLEGQLSQRHARALFMAVLIGLEAQTQGSTFVPLPSKQSYFLDRLVELIPNSVVKRKKEWTPKAIVEAMEELLERRDLQILGRGAEWKPLIVDEGRLYHQRMMLHEKRLVEVLASRLKSAKIARDTEMLEAAIVDVRCRQPPGGAGEMIELSPEQEYAMLTALHMPMTLITGGPGTGKTSIVVSILRMLVRLGLAPRDIALAAPTGKAANRMAESIYGQLDQLDEPSDHDLLLAEKLENPRTLHRLMGYSPRRDEFNHHAGNPLPHRMIIVDEASMIDLFLMERLLRAVSSKAQIVLLGDADQLPSVDTGAVLRDLIPNVVSTDAAWRALVHGELKEGSGDAPTAEAAVRLERSYRMRKEDPAGREILSFARSIRDFKDDGQDLTPAKVELFDDEEMVEPKDGVRLWDGEIDRFTDWWFEQVVLDGQSAKWRVRFNRAHRLDGEGRFGEKASMDIHELLTHYGRARILTLTRVFATGSVRLNEAFHRSMAGLGGDQRRESFDFYPGEPVMMLRNDYDRNLFNGDQGIVVWCERMTTSGERDVSLMAVFERADELIAYPLTELRDVLEHAFAMTVHKAQGSEFERVAMVLPTQQMALLNRELLYTGLTRASRAVLLVGAPELLAIGAGNRSERFSAVGEKLAAHFEDTD